VQHLVIGEVGGVEAVPPHLLGGAIRAAHPGGDGTELEMVVDQDGVGGPGGEIGGGVEPHLEVGALADAAVAADLDLDRLLQHRGGRKWGAGTQHHQGSANEDEGGRRDL